MGSITTAMPNSFKVEVLKGVHDFTASSGHTFKLALLKDIGSLSDDYDADTATYGDVSGDELANGNGYTTGGIALTTSTPILDDNVAICDFNDVTWTNATFMTSGGVIYNDSAPGKPLCAVISFNGDQQVSAGDFQLRFPVPDKVTAILRIE